MPEGITVDTAKNGEITASFDGNFLHSAYNPGGEAKKFAQSNAVNKADCIVFYGVGIGYGAIACAEYHKAKTLIIAEPNPQYILWAFSLLDWEPVFKLASIVFLIDAPQQSVIAIIEHFGLNESIFITHRTIMQHAEKYFTDLQTLVERNKDKQSINQRTLEKFSILWLSNMCKNMRHIAKLDGIRKYQDKAGDLPSCVLAAGPTLDAILPYLHDIKKRCILICVDTALRACLAAGVQPHFIILVDPQYWNFRHLAGLNAPESILITESAAYPSVFRFVCKETVLCSSLFPFGKYIEKFTGNKGELSPGGSVATTAWDFARFIGSKNIFMAGLDLSYPHKKTHATGSTFEQRMDSESKKLAPTETANARILYNAHTKYSQNNKGESTVTDARMELYAWWFESKCAKYPNIHTFTVSPDALYIPGISLCNTEDILTLPDNEQAVQMFCDIKDCNAYTGDIQTISDALYNELYALKNIVQKAICICKKDTKTDTECENILHELNQIDKEIYSNSVKSIVSLVFPTENQLQKLMAENLPEEPPLPPAGTYRDAAKYNILKSQTVYDALQAGIDMYLHYLQKNI